MTILRFDRPEGSPDDSERAGATDAEHGEGKLIDIREYLLASIARIRERREEIMQEFSRIDDTVAQWRRAHEHAEMRERDREVLNDRFLEDVETREQLLVELRGISDAFRDAINRWETFERQRSAGTSDEVAA